MNIFIIALGTRGDVQPYVALGLGLQKAGHEVTLCTTANFRDFVSEYGLRFSPTSDDIMELMHTDAGRAVFDDDKSWWETAKVYAAVAKQAGPMQAKMLEETWEAAEKAKPDLILYHPKGYGAPHFAEKLGIPVMLALLIPGMVPTSAFPAIGLPAWNWGGWYNRWTARMLVKLTAMGVGKYIKAWRQAHGMLALRRGVDMIRTPAGQPIPVMHGFSEHVMPPVTDWPSHAAMTGYWFLKQPNDWQPPASLIDFLNAGAPPIYVGFGSMAGRKTAHVSRIVIEAFQKAKVRGIFATGWGGLEAKDLPDSIYKMDSAPHDWLFPRMAAVVHHGGAGTTSAGLRAGRPTLICPFFGDQPFWGKRIHELGAGPAAIPQKKLGVENLAGAFRELVDNPTFRRNAEAIAEKLEQEDSMANAVDFIERHVKPQLPR